MGTVIRESHKLPHTGNGRRPAFRGNNTEGSEYVNEVWVQTTDILSLIESCRRERMCGHWSKGGNRGLHNTYIHAVQPGGRSNSGTITSGTIAAGSTSLNVASASTFEVGQNI